MGKFAAYLNLALAVACVRVREAFRQYAPHKKKRCVPMTGKQKCEVVPGGCTQ